MQLSYHDALAAKICHVEGETLRGFFLCVFRAVPFHHHGPYIFSNGIQIEQTSQHKHLGITSI